MATFNGITLPVAPRQATIGESIPDANPRALTAAEWAAANTILAAGDIGVESDTGVARIGDGVTPYLNLSAGVRTFKMTGASPLANSTVGASTLIPGTEISVQTNHQYIWSAMGIYQSAATTTGIAFGAATPVLVDSDYWRAEIQQGGSGTDQYYQQSAGAFGATLVSTSVVTADTSYFFKLEGIFTPSADGTVQPRFRTEVDLSEVRLYFCQGYLIDCGI